MWQSDAEADPEERARINAAFAGVKSGQLANVREQLQEFRVMLKRLLDVALVDGYGETVRDEAEALLRAAGETP